MTIGEALEAVLSRIAEDVQTGTEEVWLLDSTGRVLAEDVTAGMNVPGFNRSAMDGYAVKASDVRMASPEAPVRLKVAGELMAGDIPRDVYSRGCAYRVMTGAPVPDGCDCVVRQEDTDLGKNEVLIFKSPGAGGNYCPVGEDISMGSLILRKGELLDPARISVLASLGMARVRVKKSIRTSFISTGSEVVSPGHELEEGQIYNSSAYLMAASVKRMGLEMGGLKAIKDDVDILAGEIREAAERSHILVTTGGVSVGEKDLIPEVLEKIGAQILFRNVDIQPGTPTIGAMLGDTVLLCLSGNPFAAFANFEVYYRDIAARMMGCKALGSVTGTAVMDCSYEKKNVHTRLVRAYVRDGHVTLPEKTHHSSVVSNLINCNCLIELEPGRSLVPGDSVRIRYL